MIKEGWKTTEFWVTVLPLTGIILAVLLGKLTVDEAKQLWPLILGGGGYAVARGLAKMK